MKSTNIKTNRQRQTNDNNIKIVLVVGKQFMNYHGNWCVLSIIVYRFLFEYFIFIFRQLLRLW